CLIDAKKDKQLAEKMRNLATEINQGIKDYGIINDPDFGEIFAYEVDGLGNYLFMDDANVPSLLSLPYLQYIDRDNSLYKNTRRAILSNKNKNYFMGKAADGIGSDHTPEDYIWHIALSMQMMTSSDEDEKNKILEYFENTHANTYLMHEGFHKDNPNKYTRDWFSWSNSMFCEAILNYIGLELIKN
ncbi:MAG: glycoside hydrolase family 125 protein, partial [Anaerococcus sp.]|nr:glycoside hydrolase family 125 protein [Anaerococcus sp.]